MNPVVVVTRASLAGEAKQQEELKTSIADRFNIPPNSIYMFDNYTKEDEKTLRIDKKTLDILTKVIESCRVYQKFHSQTLLKDLTKEQPRQVSSPNQSRPAPVQSPTKVQVVSSTGQTRSSPQTVSGPKCPNAACKQEVEPEWVSCPYCETDLSKVISPPVSSDHCHSCNSPMKEAFKFCPKCKTPRPQPAPPAQESKCWSCQEEVEPDWDECPVCSSLLIRPPSCCGLPIKPAFSHCPKCKKKFPPK